MNTTLVRKAYSKICTKLWDMEARRRNMVDSGDEVEEATYDLLNRQADAIALDLGIPLRDRWEV